MAVLTPTTTPMTATHSAFSSASIPRERVRNSTLYVRKTLTPARNMSRLISRKVKLRSLRMSNPHADRPICSHDRPRRGFATALPSRTNRNVPAAVANSTTPRKMSGRVKSPSRYETEMRIAPVTKPTVCIAPDERARKSDLLRRHEVRHVALERALREVRAELEQDHEDDERDERLGRGEPDQEDDVEDAADDDVRLAPAPAAHREVADHPDRRLDEEHDRQRQPAHQRQVGRGLAGRSELVDALLVEDPDAAPDRIDAEPVDRDLDKLADRQPLGRASARVVVIHDRNHRRRNGLDGQPCPPSPRASTLRVRGRSCQRSDDGRLEGRVTPRRRVRARRFAGAGPPSGSWPPGRRT